MLRATVTRPGLRDEIDQRTRSIGRTEPSTAEQRPGRRDLLDLCYRAYIPPRVIGPTTRRKGVRCLRVVEMRSALRTLRSETRTSCVRTHSEDAPWTNTNAQTRPPYLRGSWIHSTGRPERYPTDRLPRNLSGDTLCRPRRMPPLWRRAMVVLCSGTPQRSESWATRRSRSWIFTVAICSPVTMPIVSDRPVAPAGSVRRSRRGNQSRPSTWRPRPEAAARFGST
jgi:hypothetical protein